MLAHLKGIQVSLSNSLGEDPGLCDLCAKSDVWCGPRLVGTRLTTVAWQSPSEIQQVNPGAPE